MPKESKEEEEVSNILSIGDAIKALEDMNSKGSIEDTMPFSKIKFKLSPPLAKHTSKINSIALTSNAYNESILFNNLVNDLISDLVELEDGKTLKNFHIYDYHYLVFKIREMISPKIKFDDDTEDFDIKSKLEEFSKQDEIKTKEVGDKVCRVGLRLPSYFRMQKFDKAIAKKIKVMTKDGEDGDVEEYMKYTFKNLIVRFISSISIIIDKEEKEISLHNLPRIEDQMRLVDNIPNEIFSKIYSAIDEMLKPTTDLKKIDDENSIQLDSSFFLEVE